jgi:hypothetical protein
LQAESSTGSSILSAGFRDAAVLACGTCIMIMMSMLLEKLLQVDLNLLITFAAIAEEKSVTADDATSNDLPVPVVTVNVVHGSLAETNEKLSALLNRVKSRRCSGAWERRS